MTRLFNRHSYGWLACRGLGTMHWSNEHGAHTLYLLRGHLADIVASCRILAAYFFPLQHDCYATASLTLAISLQPQKPDGPSHSHIYQEQAIGSLPNKRKQCRMQNA